MSSALLRKHLSVTSSLKKGKQSKVKIADLVVQQKPKKKRGRVLSKIEVERSTLKEDSTIVKNAVKTYQALAQRPSEDVLQLIVPPAPPAPVQVYKKKVKKIKKPKVKEAKVKRSKSKSKRPTKK